MKTQTRRAQAKLAKRTATKHPQPRGGDAVRRPSWPRWAVAALCLLLAGGGTWAAMEFVVWSKLPPELVGKWVVQGGPQDGATFDFYRTGGMSARLNNNGSEVRLDARAAVQGKRLLTTTQNPRTRQDETRTCTIRELTPSTLVLETEQGEVFRMVRAE
jgi:uncharacterized protein (TIGR03066 family)